MGELRPRADRRVFPVALPVRRIHAIWAILVVRPQRTFVPVSPIWWRPETTEAM
jgi:hypothetical protein